MTIRSVPDEEGREPFLQTVNDILDKNVERGYVLVFTDKDTWDFNHNNSISQVRDALLSYARDLAAYEGD